MSNETIDKLKLEFAALTKMVKDVIGKKQTLKFGEMMTADGKVLSYDGDLAEGVAVMIDGGPAADGAYTLEDGTVCNVKDGKIESLVAPTENKDEAFADKFAAMEKRFTDFEAKYEEGNTNIATQFEALSKTLTAITEQMGKQLEVVGQFAAQTPDPIEKPTNRKLEKIEKNVAAARLVDQMLEEINKQKN
jgi:hypothetical protein